MIQRWLHELHFPRVNLLKPREGVLLRRFEELFFFFFGGGGGGGKGDDLGVWVGVGQCLVTSRIVDAW